MNGLVLIVDDSAVNRFMLAQVVRARGCQVVEASGGQQAIDIGEAQEIDLVLLDIRMPEVDGFAVLEYFKSKEKLNHIPIIMVSSLDDLEATVRCIELGAEDYLMKPFEPTLLTARLRACLEKKQFLQELIQLKRDLQKRNEDLEVANLKLEELAFTDALSGVPNRRFALDTLHRLWSTSLRTGRPLSAMLCDIDHFKRINDTYGHDCGDRVIRVIAQTLASGGRASDVACRFGGEEFLILCPDTDATACALVGNRLRGLVTDAAIDFPGFDQKVTISIGVAEKNSEMENWNQIVSSADEALYEAKRNGRNRVHCFVKS